MSSDISKKCKKYPRQRKAGDLLYSEEPKSGHAEDAGKDGYLVIGNKPRPDFERLIESRSIVTPSTCTRAARSLCESRSFSRASRMRSPLIFFFPSKSYIRKLSPPVC